MELEQNSSSKNDELPAGRRLSRLDDSLVPGVPSQLPAWGAPAAGERGGYRPRRRRPPREGQREKDARRDGHTVRSFSFSLPHSLAQRWKDYASSSRASQVDVVLDAVQANAERLVELVMNKQLIERKERGLQRTGLFVRPGTPLPGRPEDPTVTVAVRMVEPNVEMLDHLASTSGAESRSQLVAVCLESYLEEVTAHS